MLMKRFLRILGRIFAVVWGLIVIILAIVFLGTSGVKKAANWVLDQMQQGQMETVYNASVLPTVLSYSDWTASMWVGTPMSIANAELQWWNGRGFEWSEKYIYGTFLFENGQEETLTFWFEEVEDEYVLLGITWWIPDSSDF